MRTIYILSALVVGILIGVCATLALYVVKPGPDAGDWLTFAGALIGVVLTIGATVVIEDFRNWNKFRQDLDMLIATLNDIKKFIDDVMKPRGDRPLEDAILERAALEAGLLKSLDNFNFFRSHLPRRAIEAWNAADRLSYQLERERPTLEKELGLLDENTTETVLAINISKTQQIADRLSPLVDTAEQKIASVKF